MPSQPSLIASDGFEYENIAQRLLGKHKESLRNGEILSLRRYGCEESEVEAFYRAYDSARGDHLHRYSAGWRAVDRERIAHPC